MDLATLVVYLNEDNFSFNGFIASWENLKLNSISLDHTSLDQFFKLMEYNYLFFQAEDEFIKNTAINNSDLSQLVYAKLDSLLAEYQNAVLELPDSDMLLDNLGKDLESFLANSIIDKIALLPRCFYNNIDALYDKIQNQIASEKHDDFRHFIYNVNMPKKSEVEWYSKLLYSKNIEYRRRRYFSTRKLRVSNFVSERRFRKEERTKKT
jgi:hypothetical protein